MTSGPLTSSGAAPGASAGRARPKRLEEQLPSHLRSSWRSPGKRRRKHQKLWQKRPLLLAILVVVSLLSALAGAQYGRDLYLGKRAAMPGPVAQITRPIHGWMTPAYLVESRGFESGQLAEALRLGPGQGWNDPLQIIARRQGRDLNLLVAALGALQAGVPGATAAPHMSMLSHRMAPRLGRAYSDLGLPAERQP